jgi:hypothetical protein
MPFINALELCSWIFGTKGEVLPVVVVVSALAKEQQHYHFTFITHAAHNIKSLSLPDLLKFCTDRGFTNSNHLKTLVMDRC